MTKVIEAEALTTFQVSADGARIQLNGKDAEGAPVAMSLPADCMREMVMSLPRIAQEALRRQHCDPSLRVVYPTSTWAIQRGHGQEATAILTLCTSDGFEVSFGFDPWLLRSFETSVRAAVELSSRAAELN